MQNGIRRLGGPAGGTASVGLRRSRGIWNGGEIPADFPSDLAVGYHLAFQADWLDFFREDKAALVRKFGSLDGETGTFEFLMENQWWPGFTMTDPDQTAYLLDAVRYPRKGIMLDTGHLLNTNPDLHSEGEGVAYIHSILDAHGDLCRYIRGFHFNLSLSGDYVHAHTGMLPPLPQEYMGCLVSGFSLSTSYQSANTGIFLKFPDSSTTESLSKVIPYRL